MMKRLGLILIVLLLAATAHAQTGTIVGRVIDKETKEPLTGARVYVKEKRLGATANVNGDFKILHVPTGIHSLGAFYVEFFDSTAHNITVQSDSSTEVLFMLRRSHYSADPGCGERPLIDKTQTTSGRIFNESHYFYPVGR
ncbi:MAG: carboxypeptidase-like regulatory domain-containing protein [Rhizobacter sp.]|nr:carboxypeptidase-like regulatory domain-containing protein [Chlorobiales bacterium]